MSQRDFLGDLPFKANIIETRSVRRTQPFLNSVHTIKSPLAPGAGVRVTGPETHEITWEFYDSRLSAEHCQGKFQLLSITARDVQAPPTNRQWSRDELMWVLEQMAHPLLTVPVPPGSADTTPANATPLPGLFKK